MRPAAFPASLPACTKLPEALSGTKRKGLSGGKERPDRGRRPLRCHVRHVSSKKGLFRISLEHFVIPASYLAGWGNCSIRMQPAVHFLSQ